MPHTRPEGQCAWVGRRRRWRRRGAEGLDPEIEQKQPAEQPEPHPLVDQRIGHCGQAEAGDGAVEPVGGRRAHAGKQPDDAAVGQRAADAEDADRPDRRGDGKADEPARDEKSEAVHGAALVA